jgi:hypothetical protein
MKHDATLGGYSGGSRRRLAHANEECREFGASVAIMQGLALADAKMHMFGPALGV